MNSLEEIIERVRKTLIELGKRHPYIATNLSTLEIQAVLQEEINDRDHILLPAHHASTHYCLQAEKGQKINLGKLGTEELPYVFHVGKGSQKTKYNSGAMGASMPVAVTKALINPHEKTYVLIGNAEMREGRSYESLAFIDSKCIDNLVVMINDNKKSLDGQTSLNYSKILNSFGFEVREIDGHNIAAICNVINEAKESSKRFGIVFKTERGHKTEFSEKAYDEKFNEKKSKKRTYVGKAIERLAKKRDFTVLAADTAKSTGLGDITLVDEKRLHNVGCSEQLLIGGLESYQLQGMPVVAGTFAKFALETAREQVEGLIANYNEGHVNTPTVIVATHNGLSPGVNGRSHHALTSYEFLGRQGVNLYHANGETQFEAMMDEALNKPELTIILTERESESFILRKGQQISKYKDFYADNFEGENYYQFHPGIPEEMTDFDSNNYTLLITNGLRLHDALNVAQQEDNVEILSLPSFPINEACLTPYLQQAKKVIIVEESIKPYLGEHVELIGKRSGSTATYEYMHVTDPGFGGYEALIRRNNLNAKGMHGKIVSG